VGRALCGIDIPGIRCAIPPDETGLLLPPGDEHALQCAIVRLASDSALRLRLGQNALRRVEREFDLKTALKSLFDYYQSNVLQPKNMASHPPK
jgi:glycosyltransferase involved in cell wall biosynthesis